MAKAPISSANKSKKIVTILVILACIGVIWGIKFYIEFKRNQLVQMNTMRVKGNKKSSIKIIEYIDFQCPACASGAKMLKEYMDLHPDQIYLEMKYFPLPMHQHAYTSAYYAECALKQGKFWEFHDLLISRQLMWSALPDARSAFDGMAKELNLRMGDLQTCLNDEKTKETVLKTRQEGELLGVKSTPTYLLNDQMIVGFKNIQTELDVRLAKEKK